MTGPEHYREAERLIELASYPARVVAGPPDRVEPPFGPGPLYQVGETMTITDQTLLAAQVHATLALAAATAEPIALSYDGNYDTAVPRAWSEAIS